MTDAAFKKVAPSYFSFDCSRSCIDVSGEPVWWSSRAESRGEVVCLASSESFLQVNDSTVTHDHFVALVTLESNLNTNFEADTKFRSTTALLHRAAYSIINFFGFKDEFSLCEQFFSLVERSSRMGSERSAEVEKRFRCFNNNSISGQHGPLRGPYFDELFVVYF